MFLVQVVALNHNKIALAVLVVVLLIWGIKVIFL